MENIPLPVLFIALFFLIIFSGFFSSSETAMMSLNRYRLRHLAEEGQKSAVKAETLLSRPDRLIGLILLGNNLVNIIAASIATLIGIRLLGDLGVALAPFILVIIFLVFAEVLPKTVAAIKPEKIAFPASYVLTPLMKLSYPAVWLVNLIANGILNRFGFKIDQQKRNALSQDELRTIVREAGALIPQRHQQMLLSVLDLENITVDNIMVPRNEINAIDLGTAAGSIIKQIKNCQHTRLPVYQETIDNIIGVLHIKHSVNIINNDKAEPTIDELKSIIKEAHFVPKGTSLHTQLRNFQKNKCRFGIVVDEYGSTQGIVTLEAILEEIIGEFTTDIQSFNLDIQPQKDGYYLVDGAINIREINRQLNWQLPTDGPRTLNGILLERLEQIPVAGTALRIDNYMIEIVQVTDNAVKTARLKLLYKLKKSTP